MKFGEKYVTCLVGEEPEVGLVKMDEEQICEGCYEAQTPFMDIGLLGFICSDECRKRAFRIYLEMANGDRE